MRKTFIFAGVSMIVALLSLGGYAYAYDYLETMRRSVLSTEVASAERIAQESREGAHQLFVETSIEREALERFFVREDQVATVVEQLENLGRREGVVVEVSAIGIGQGGSSGGARRVRPVDITVQAVGSRVATENFLKRAEYFPYILSIEQVSLERLRFTEAGGDRWRLAVGFRIGIRR